MAILTEGMQARIEREMALDEYMKRERCGYVPPTPGYAPCSRKPHLEGPCAHELLHTLRGFDEHARAEGLEIDAVAQFEWLVRQGFQEHDAYEIADILVEGGAISYVKFGDGSIEWSRVNEARSAPHDAAGDRITAQDAVDALAALSKTGYSVSDYVLHESVIDKLAPLHEVPPPNTFAGAMLELRMRVADVAEAICEAFGTSRFAGWLHDRLCTRCNPAIVTFGYAATVEALTWLVLTLVFALLLNAVMP